MKKLIFIPAFILLSIISFAQNKAEADKLVDEGIAYHDKGDFNGAISKYDRALDLDKDNLLALAEKAYSLFSLKEYDEVIKCCKRAIKMHEGEKESRMVYVTYGNALDAQNKTDKAIDIYDEGIKIFPEFYQLYYNKGITLSSVKKWDDANACFQKSVLLNPKHASSHNAIARLADINDKRIPSLLAYCRFLAIEPQGSRAKENLENLLKLMKGNVEKTGENSITINISPEMLSDSTKDGKKKENSFVSTDMILAMGAALDHDDKYKNENDVERFTRNLTTVCESLKETQKGNFGFFWEYYVPYFVEMKDKNLLETFGYIAFASSEDKAAAEWLKSNKTRIDEFFEWSKSFKWKTI